MRISSISRVKGFKEVTIRLRVGRGLAKTEAEASVQALCLLKKRSQSDHPPGLVSDGWGGHREALLEVCGEVPTYRGRGRPPSKKRAQPDWQYLQVVKQRENGPVIGTETRVICGDKQLTPALLGEHTAYVERTNLTIRHTNGRLVRKTLGFSKQYAMLKAACIQDEGRSQWLKGQEAVKRRRASSGWIAFPLSHEPLLTWRA